MNDIEAEHLVGNGDGVDTGHELGPIVRIVLAELVLTLLVVAGASPTSRSNRVAAQARSQPKVRAPSTQAPRPASASNSRCTPAWTAPHVHVQHADGTTETVDLTVTGDFRD